MAALADAPQAQMRPRIEQPGSTESDRQNMQVSEHCHCMQARCTCNLTKRALPELQGIPFCLLLPVFAHSQGHQQSHRLREP